MIKNIISSLELLCKSDDWQFVESPAIFRLSNKHHRKIHCNFSIPKKI